MEYIVLSGCSGGIGLTTVKKLTDNGYHVFGLDINEPKESFPHFTYIKTNLRDESSIQESYQKVLQITDEITSIISMAGVYDLNSLIEISEEDFLKIFDINVFSMYRLNKIFMPLLKEKGKVIMVSSELAPLDPLPFTGLYGISKSTVEKYAYSLRMELQLLDKYVSIIRPGAVNTSLLDVSTTKLNKFTENTTHYQYNAKRFKKIVDNVESKKVSPSKIADIVYKIISKKKPRYVYKVNRNPLLLLLNILPQRTQNWIIKKILLSKGN